jgi:gas vesicle protein
LRRIDHFTSLMAGFGVGLAASILLAPEAGGKTRSRIGDMAKRVGGVGKDRAEILGVDAGSALKELQLTLSDPRNEGRQTMSDLKDKAEQKLEDAADATKTAADKLVHKSKEVAHSAGEKMEEGADRLQKA